MDDIVIVLAADDNYAQHAAVTEASILLHTTEPQRVSLYILSDGISETKQQKIKDTVNDLKGRVQLIAVDGDAIEGFTSGHISKAAYLRLMIPELLPDHVEKAIYFDTDLVVTGDVAELWQLSLGGHPVGATVDLGIMSSKRSRREKHASIGLHELDDYFNSGMMVIDVSQWRVKNYGNAVLAEITSNQFRHHDQDGLNKVFKNDWQELPLRWNVIPPVFSLPLKILCSAKWRKKAIEALKSPAVIHWAGRYKPWEFTYEKAFNGIYYEALKETRFNDAVMPQLSKDMHGKSLARQLMRIHWAKFWQAIGG